MRLAVRVAYLCYSVYRMRVALIHVCVHAQSVQNSSIVFYVSLLLKVFTLLPTLTRRLTLLPDDRETPFLFTRPPNFLIAIFACCGEANATKPWPGTNGSPVSHTYPTCTYLNQTRLKQRLMDLLYGTATTECFL